MVTMWLTLLTCWAFLQQEQQRVCTQYTAIAKREQHVGKQHVCAQHTAAATQAYVVLPDAAY
jgi:hypothetical protein